MEVERGCKCTCLKRGSRGYEGESLARRETSGSGGDCDKVEGRPLPWGTAMIQHQLLVTCENLGQGLSNVQVLCMKSPMFSTLETTPYYIK